MQDLLDKWTARAEKYEAAAHGYNRKCTSHKGVQLTLRAKEVRTCIDELRQLAEASGDGNNQES